MPAQVLSVQHTSYHHSPEPAVTSSKIPLETLPAARGVVPSDVHWLSCNRHVTEKQLFAHVTSEMQSLLASAAKGKSQAWPQGSAEAARHHGRRPATSVDFGYVEIFPRNATETPALLASLERSIAAATYGAASAAVPLRRRAAPTSSPTAAAAEAPSPPPAASPHKPSPSSNLAFQLHARALDEFIAGFPTYVPLMSEIKRELDGAINDAVRCAKESVELRRRRAEALRAREIAIDEAYKKAAAAALDFRRSVHQRLIVLEERQIDAQRRTAASHARASALSADITSVRADVARLLQTNQRLRAVGKAEEEWPRGARAALAGQTLGQVTREMERALDPDAGPALRKSAT